MRGWPLWCPAAFVLVGCILGGPGKGGEMVVDFLPQNPGNCVERVLTARYRGLLDGTGVYNFSGVPALPDPDPSPLYKGVGGALYLISDISWRLSEVTEDSYINAYTRRSPYLGPLVARFSWSGLSGGVLQSVSSIPLTVYFQGQPLRFFTLNPSGEGSANLTLTLSGSLDAQYFATPIPSPNEYLSAVVFIRMYEITDSNFIARFNTLGAGGLGLCEHSGAL
jgi:hypothetical protein